MQQETKIGISTAGLKAAESKRLASVVKQAVLADLATTDRVGKIELEFPKPGSGILPPEWAGLIIRRNLL